MNSTIHNSTAYTGYRGEQFKQKVKDNSNELTYGGGAGLATFTTINQSSKIGNNLVRAVKTSTKIKAQKQEQILGLLAKCKPLAKFVNNPIVKKGAGIFAGLSAATTLVGSTAKIADTYGYLSNQNVA